MTDPKTINIKPNPETHQLRFRLQFPGSTRREPIEFDLSYDASMGLMVALQQIQAQHKIPIPDPLRPHGKPNLSVVQVDD